MRQLESVPQLQLFVSRKTLVVFVSQLPVLKAAKLGEAVGTAAAKGDIKQARSRLSRG